MGLAPEAVKPYRDALRHADDALGRRFDAGEPVHELVADRASIIDDILVDAWQKHAGDLASEVCLVAVGGYGRSELHPGSDIDVMVLVPGKDLDRWQPTLERFLTFLWDIGLEIGHSTRSIDDCVTESRKDITVATSLMESRCLCGPDELFKTMRASVGPDRVWPSDQFFEAKLAEQKARHHRFHDTSYNLEPNVKSSPGNLRDIQMVGWVAKRHFNVGSLEELADLHFLTSEELHRLKEGQDFLWRIRYALHRLTGRCEDRLLFDYQMTLADKFGFEDDDRNLAVEQFMQRYYRTVMELSRLNEMLLELFQEAILMEPDPNPEKINDRFQMRNGFLETTANDTFAKHPSAMLEMFVVLQQRQDLNGVSASTIRQVCSQVSAIDDDFRAKPVNRELFMDIIRAPQGVTHGLRRMNRYGVLGAYLPEFGRVVGRMQYDLFHAYTVDEHTLFVVSNLRRFALPRYDHEFPDCSRIMQSLEKPELAYLAGLFHDIAKGRGGDHSELGAQDAEAFCLDHGLSNYEERFVSWLVYHHLAFSVTAQKQDISDPQVIHDFATLVGDQLHLDYLYLLTIADVRATNPNLWNSWKQSLFGEFYERVREALRRGLENPPDREVLIQEKQEKARHQLLEDGLDNAQIDAVWKQFDEEYFLRFSKSEICWHTSLLDQVADDSSTALVAIPEEPESGGSAILIHASASPDLFPKATAVIDEMGLNICDARITPMRDGRSLHAYQVLERDGQPIKTDERREEIKVRLSQAAGAQQDRLLRVSRRAPRQVRMFSTATRIHFSPHRDEQSTIMELVSGDRPGLLSDIGRAIHATGINIKAAKVMTIGERAEDVFYICDAGGRPLDEATSQSLHDALMAILEDRN